MHISYPRAIVGNAGELRECEQRVRRTAAPRVRMLPLENGGEAELEAGRYLAATWGVAVPEHPRHLVPIRAEWRPHWMDRAVIAATKCSGPKGSCRCSDPLNRDAMIRAFVGGVGGALISRFGEGAFDSHRAATGNVIPGDVTLKP